MATVVSKANSNSSLRSNNTDDDDETSKATEVHCSERTQTRKKVSYEPRRQTVRLSPNNGKLPTALSFIRRVGVVGNCV